MQNQRLFGIVYTLLNKKIVSAQELALQYEVTKRTIYRDIETLCMAGIPIYTITGRNGGYALDANFTLDKTELREQEKEDLGIALQAFKSIRKNQLSSKIESFLKPTENWLQIDFDSWNEVSLNEIFSLLESAIKEKHLVTFHYINSNNQKSKRTVKPYQLLYKSKSFYLIGYCTEKKEMRMFKLSRIKQLTVENEIFKDVLHYNRKNECIPTINIKMIVSQNQLYRIYDEFDEKNVKLLKDGKYLIEIAYPENEWLYGYLLSFGEDLQLLEPLSLKQKLKDKINKMIENYK